MNSTSPSAAEKLKRIENAPHDVQSMVELAAILREPGGCDWDRKQDLTSMQPHLLEEAHELIHAIANSDLENFKEELGDLLFLVVFFARLAEEKGWFSLYDAARASVDKLIFRHPHVFGDLEVNGAGEVLKNWEKLKEKEKERKNDKSQQSSANGVRHGGDESQAPSPETRDGKAQGLEPGGTQQQAEQKKSEFGKNTAYLPGLHRAEKLQKKAALKGFDWTNIRDVREKLNEELAELDELIEQLESAHTPASDRSATDTAKSGSVPVAANQSTTTDEATALKKKISGELGDVMFCVVNLARHLDVPAELSIHETCEKFITRFRTMEELSKVELESLSLDELEELYQTAKSRTTS
tara:strand:+ start:711 stop:1775 length:1065 start_codon:yes stop_codon:yes gene_type:complete